MRFTNFLLTGFLMTAAAPAQTASLIVHLTDNVGIGRLELSNAKRHATDLLAAAGIRVRIVECPCKPSHDPSMFAVSIEEKMPERLRGVLGYALPLTEAANKATLNYSKIRQTLPANVEYLLGTVLAHELGHLLFRSVNHGTGVMKEQYDKQDLKLMTSGRLLFSADQAADLRAGLDARVTASMMASTR